MNYHNTDIADDTYRNYYACACGHAWSDDYSCKIGDRCPSCGTVTEPHTSEILMTEPEWRILMDQDHGEKVIMTGGRSYWMEIGETDTEAYLLTVHFGPFANRAEAEAFGDLLNRETVFGGTVLVQ